MMVMYKGEVIENGKSESFIDTNNHHPYTSRLIGISKNISKKYSNENLIDGFNSGCKYYSKCSLENKNDTCKEFSPLPIDINNGEILLSEDPNRNWVKCWDYYKKNII